jgi:hypothetical protein
VAETGIVGQEFCFQEFVAILIHERNLARQELIGEAGCVNKEFGVAMMARTFSPGDRRCVTVVESFSCSADQLRLGVHRSSGNVFNDIGLENNRIAADVQIEKAKSLVDELVEFVRVPLRIENGDT